MNGLYTTALEYTAWTWWKGECIEYVIPIKYSVIIKNSFSERIFTVNDCADAMRKECIDCMTAVDVNTVVAYQCINRVAAYSELTIIDEGDSIKRWVGRI